ncbi:MAG: GNAT family N-acetyltransferase [Anaerolineales bacterium]|uniref:GNAT family N-acetyltransferase n=1 Tax=Candidatus Villigracilis proximus TaxID=3140683 RepID=UPI003136CAED|nr:GNAT family N-acetyltransferase [Anaerolineales bacterium]
MIAEHWRRLQHYPSQGHYRAYRPANTQFKCLTPKRVYLSLVYKWVRLEQELGIPISREIVTENTQRAIRKKLSKMTHADQAQLAWYTYWLLVIRTVPFGAGLVGFKGFPDQNGEAEIGYGIDQSYQRQGYTTEAVKAMIAWAFEEISCRAVVARNTKKSNLASQRVFLKAGMKVYEESEDAFCLRVER